MAEFLKYIGKPDVDATWARTPATFRSHSPATNCRKQQGYYTKNVGADIPVEQLARGTMTPNTKGLRLGRLPEIRNIIQEELEKALQGGQTAQQAMDVAVTRGNKVLKEFAKSARA